MKLLTTSHSLPQQLLSNLVSYHVTKASLSLGPWKTWHTSVMATISGPCVCWGRPQALAEYCRQTDFGSNKSWFMRSCFDNLNILFQSLNVRHLAYEGLSFCPGGWGAIEEYVRDENLHLRTRMPGPKFWLVWVFCWWFTSSQILVRSDPVFDTTISVLVVAVLVPVWR